MARLYEPVVLHNRGSLLLKKTDLSKKITSFALIFIKLLPVLQYSKLITKH